MLSFASMMKHIRSFDRKGNPVRFKVDMVACDEKRKKAGEILHIENISVHKLRKSTPATRHRQMHNNLTGKSESQYSLGILRVFQHGTEKIITIHPRLIVKLNGDIVYY